MASGSSAGMPVRPRASTRGTGDRYEFLSILTKHLIDRQQSLADEARTELESVVIPAAEEQVDANPTRESDAQRDLVGFMSRVSDHAAQNGRSIITMPDIKYSASLCGYWPWCFVFP